MNNIGKFHELMIVLGHLGVEESLRRLECVGGSGATTCYAGREADGEQGGVDEERSDREDRRVTPGEAEALAAMLGLSLEGVASSLQMVAEALQRGITPDAGEIIARKLELLKKIERSFRLLPQPDSEAPKERSGRRNSQAQPPTVG